MVLFFSNQTTLYISPLCLKKQALHNFLPIWKQISVSRIIGYWLFKSILSSRCSTKLQHKNPKKPSFVKGSERTMLLLISPHKNSYSAAYVLHLINSTVWILSLVPSTKQGPWEAQDKNVLRIKSIKIKTSLKLNKTKQGRQLLKQRWLSMLK